MSEFHDRLKQMRMFNNLSQIDMARKLNVARQTYLDIEYGKRSPKLENVIEICSILNCNLEWLILGETVIAYQELKPYISDILIEYENTTGFRITHDQKNVVNFAVTHLYKTGVLDI